MNTCDLVPVAVLFARSDSNYRAVVGVDVFDLARDARNFAGGMPVVAHPPCRGWGRLRRFAKPAPGERELAIFAVAQVRCWGGVLEHPADSTLFAACGMPQPGCGEDAWGGYTVEVEQFHWGHRAEKRTWLYVVGCARLALPCFPVRDGRPTHCIRPTKGAPRLPTVTKAEREHTPPALCTWLVEVARRCAAGRGRAAA